MSEDHETPKSSSDTELGVVKMQSEGLSENSEEVEEEEATSPGYLADPEDGNNPQNTNHFKDVDQDVDNDDFDDDDFGSFDEASFEEFETPQSLRVPLFSLDNPHTVDEELQKMIDRVFPPTVQKIHEENPALIPLPLLSVLSKTPRLNPPNWIKLKIRHSMLIKLGVPINLDELEAPSSVPKPQPKNHGRTRSINVSDIDWEHFDIPEFGTFGKSAEEKHELLRSTHAELSRIEAENMSNTSEIFLQSSLDESLETKLAQMKQNYAQLIQLSSVWQDQISELQSSQEVYESVVQNMVGYSQKLRRNEILERLKGVKAKKDKRTF